MPRPQPAGDVGPSVAVHAEPPPRRWTLAHLFPWPKHGGRGSTPEDPSSPSSPSLTQPPRSKGRTLSRRRRTMLTPTPTPMPTPTPTPMRRRTDGRDTPRSERRRRQTTRRQTPQHQPRGAPPHRIYIDLRDTSDVWARMSTRGKLSLNSVRPSTLFQGVEPPRLWRHLRCNSEPARKRSSGGDQSHRRLPSSRARGNRGTVGSDYVVMPLPAAPGEASMPVARGLSVRFSRLPLEQRRSAAAVLMPAPDGSASDAAIDTAIGAGALNRQVGPEEHVDYPQASSAPAAQPQYVPGQSNRASVASGDEDQHSSQLFRVLGRTSSCRSREAGKAGDAMAPVLVTIARNGSVVGERTARPSDGLDRCPLLASSGPRDGPRGAAQAPPAAAYEGLRQGTHAMSPASAGISPSVGTSSFVTARMFPSTRFSEERATSTPMLDSVVEERGGLAAEARARELAFSRRQSDEVSDIAMRKHLHIGDEQAGPGHMHASPTGASQAAADQADLEWLRTQAAGQSNHEILAQRYTISQAIRQAASLRTAGPEHAGGVDDLLGRVSGLESQLTCMQAVMLSIEERLSGLSPTSHLSPSIVWPSRVGHAPGKSPVVGVVGERVQGRDLPEADAPVVGSASPPASTAAVQAATAALAELVGRSRLEFDAAASAALASIAGLAEPARSPGPQERDSSASSVDGARRSVD